MKVSILLLAALCATALLRNRPAALRHWILAAAIACALVLPIFESLMPAWPLSFASSSFAELTVAPGLLDPPQPSLRSYAARTARRAIEPIQGAAPDRVAHRSIESVVDAIWWMGIAVSLAILAVGVSRLAWLRSRSEHVTAGTWLRLSEEIAREYGLRRPVRLLQTNHPSLLATWGFMSPSISIPSGADCWPDELVRSILCHELAHIRRGDWLIQITAEIVRSVYWFNPLVWFACTRLRLESERACDDAVIRTGVDASVYASHLLGLARAFTHRPAFFPSAAMARPSSLHKRVTAMLNDRQNRSPISRSGRIAIAMLLVGIAGAIAAAQVFATFSGSLADPQGAVLPGIHVTLSNPDRQTKYDAQSNRRGEFEFVGLPPGDYVFEAQVPGFKPYRAALTMAGTDVHRTIALKIGSLHEAITIAAGADASTRTVETASPRANPPCPATSASAENPPIGGNIRAPHKIRDVRPQYPASMRDTGEDVTVVLDAVVGLDGFPKDVRVREPANREFANALVAAVTEWQYDSTLLNCVPTEVPITVTGEFLRRR